MSKFKLLEIGEVIREGDEFFNNLSEKWISFPSVVGQVYEKGWIVRRPMSLLESRAAECLEFLDIIRSIAWKNSENLSDNDKLWCRDAQEFIEEIKKEN